VVRATSFIRTTSGPQKHLTVALHHSTPPQWSETRTAWSLLPLKASSLLRGSTGVDPIPPLAQHEGEHPEGLPGK
jgi:hypothetical protein